MDENMFQFSMPITKSLATFDDGEAHMYVRGIASGVGVDREHERMASTAIEAFQKAINEGITLPNGEWSPVPLYSGHRTEWDDMLGYVTKADVDDDFNLIIEAELESDNPKAKQLFNKLTKGTRPGKPPVKLGFSVGGRIVKAGYEFSQELNKQIRVIHNVMLREISVVGEPAFAPAYVEVINKSYDWSKIIVNQAVQQESPMDTDNPRASHPTDSGVVVNDNLTPEAAEAAGQALDAALDEQATSGTVAETQTKDEVVLEPEPKDTKEILAETPGVSTQEILTQEQQASEIAGETAPAGEISEDKILLPDPNETEMTKMAKLVSDLQDTVRTLSETVSKSLKTEAEGVSKAEAVADQPDVQKSAPVEVNIIEELTKAVTAALTDFKTNELKPLVTKVENVAKAVEEMEAQPVNKSFGVLTEKERHDVVTKAVNEIANSPSPIGASIIQSFQAKFAGSNPSN